jgi:UDP-glucose 4-epimerase
MNILLTGGAGYIGSHTAITLSEAGHEAIILDNFCNSSIEVLDRLKKY